MAHLICGIIVGLFGPIFFTFDPNGYKFWKTFADMYQLGVDWVKYYYEFQIHSCFSYLEEWRAPYTGDVFDISFPRMLIGFVMACWGSLLDGLCISLILIVKTPLLIIKTYYYLWRAYMDCGCECITFMLIPFVLANIFLIPLSLIGLVCACIGSFFWGVSIAWTAYTQDVKESFNKSIENVKCADNYINDYLEIKCCHHSDIEAPAPPPPRTDVIGK
jgi:hypothetical protein